MRTLSLVPELSDEGLDALVEEATVDAEQVVSERFGLHDWDADRVWICLTELSQRWWPE